MVIEPILWANKYKLSLLWQEFHILNCFAYEDY